MKLITKKLSIKKAKLKRIKRKVQQNDKSPNNTIKLKQQSQKSTIFKKLEHYNLRHLKATTIFELPSMPTDQEEREVIHFFLF
jgi:23S rRNA A1618 N6-methylase RlmF